MGRSYWFECSKCGYRAKVSGGPDRGLHFFVQTIACLDCKQLFDAVTRLRVPDESGLMLGNSFSGLRRRRQSWQRTNLPPDFETVLNRLPFKAVKRLKWLNFKLQCPVSPFHRVQSWSAPDKCPRCGLYLEQNAIPYRIWE